MGAVVSVDGSAFVKLVFRACAVVLLLLLPVVWWVGQTPSVLGALVGCAIGLANTWAAAWLVQRLLTGPKDGKGAYGLMLAGKFLVLGLSIFVVVRVLRLDAFGILMGFTAVVVALMFGGFLFSTRQAQDDGESGI